jgi:hypothetical protein
VPKIPVISNEEFMSILDDHLAKRSIPVAKPEAEKEDDEKLLEKYQKIINKKTLPETKVSRKVKKHVFKEEEEDEKR